MSELKPLSKQITDEIRFILEGCRDGKLKHDQLEFHCGTSHCIAGWCEVIDYANARNLKTPYRITGSSEAFTHWHDDALAALKQRPDASETAAYGYAQHKWGLGCREAEALFNACATFPEQFTLLEKLEAGERVP